MPLSHFLPRLTFALAPLPVLLLAACASTGGKNLPMSESIPPAAKQPIPELYGVVDAKGLPLRDDALLRLLSSADYILIGETHNQPCHHLAQARLIELISNQGRPPAVGLEMVSVERQKVLDRFNQRELDWESLDEALEWGPNWGVDFAEYAPVFQAAQRFSLPLFALNVQRSVIHRALEEGLENLPEDERAQLTPELIWLPEEQESMLTKIFQQHQPQESKAADDETRLHRFFYVQSFWDSQMAHSARIAKEVSQRPVVVLTGSGHVMNGWGIESRLKHFDPTAQVLSFLPWDGRSAIEEGSASAFYFCPSSGASLALH